VAVKRIATLIALAAGGWLLARKLLGWDDYDQPPPESAPAVPVPGGLTSTAAGPSPDEAATAPAADEPTPTAAAETPDGAAAIPGGFESNGSLAPASASKAELYEQAKRLGIEGRSKMSREELAEAVSRARHG
jgi:hypothetical protein